MTEITLTKADCKRVADHFGRDETELQDLVGQPLTVVANHQGLTVEGLTEILGAHRRQTKKTAAKKAPVKRPTAKKAAKKTTKKAPAKKTAKKAARKRTAKKATRNR